MAQVLESLRAEFHDRAVALTDYNEGAATAFRADAGRIDTELNRYLDEPLAIEQAAAEFRWDYEALRRRLRRDSLTRTEPNGRHVMTRRTLQHEQCIVLLIRAFRERGPGRRVEASGTPTKGCLLQRKPAAPGAISPCQLRISVESDHPFRSNLTSRFGPI